MQNELDSKFLLRVFDKITNHGDKTDDGHRLDGVTAFSDFDGYTVFLQDAKVKMSFGFHNTYHFDYDSSQDFADFEKKLKNIDREYDGAASV
jgi:hypothetical protein